MAPPTSPKSPTQRDRLLSGEGLKPNQSLQSNNGDFTMTLQSDGNFVLRGAENQPLWATNNLSENIFDVIMQSDGNLVVYDSDSNVLWASDTGPGNPGAFLILHADGNAVVTGPGNNTLWATDTVAPPTPLGYTQPDRLLSGESLIIGASLYSPSGEFILTLQSDGNLVFYNSTHHSIWSSNTTNPDVWDLLMQSDGNLVLYSGSGSSLWATDTNENPNSTLIVQDSGGFALFNSKNESIWSAGSVTSLPIAVNPTPTGSVSISHATTSTPTSPTNSTFISSGHGSSDHTAAIVGGVLGAIIALLLVFLGVCIFLLFSGKHEKRVYTVAETAEPRTPPADARASNGTASKPAGSYDSTGIFIAFAVVSIPFALLAAALLGAVLGYRLKPSTALGFVNDSMDDSGVYYVNLSATTITLISSYSSTVAPIAISFAMTLIAYSMSADIVNHSKRAELDDLPTPYQLGLILNLRQGGIGSLIPWVKYAFWKVRHKSPAVLRATVGVAIAAIVLGLLITLADTWLHLTTKSVLVYIQTPNDHPLYSFSRALNVFCSLPKNTALELPCTLIEGLATLILVNGFEGYKTVGNSSSLNQLLTTTDSHSGLSYVLLGDARTATANIDFSASTVALSTQCQPISAQCGLASYGSPTPYYCSSEFQGDLDVRVTNTSRNGGIVWRMNFFNDTELTIPTDADGLPQGTNPVYIAIAALVNDATLTLSPNGTQGIGGPPGSSNGTDTVDTQTYGEAFILFCNATVYDANYTWINGSVYNIQVAAANYSMSNIVNGPQQLNMSFGLPYYESAAIAAAGSTTAQDVADQIALAYSRTALGLAAGVFVQAPNIKEATREQLLVAMVPYAPLYSLVAVNLVYVAIGSVIAIIAIHRQQMNGVNMLISMWGIIAHAFESEVPDDADTVENWFSEKRKGEGVVLGVEQVGDGGVWKFKTWKTM